MEAKHKDIEEIINKNDKIIDIWARRNPRFEKKYGLKKEEAKELGLPEGVICRLSDYGVGASKNTENKGKIFGSGYEPYIIAFFIGLYANKKLPLSEDSSEVKVLGQPIQFWGNLDSKKGRHAYSGLRSYIFMALVAKTDVDWIALDKGDIKVSTVVTQLINTMEEYANYGFSVMDDKLKSDSGYFFSNRSFLDIFLDLTQEKSKDNDVESPEEL